VLSDTDCLNAASPWLSVVSDADPDPWNTRLWAGFLILLGIAIMLPARTVRKPVEITPEITPSPDSGRAPLRQRRNWPLPKRLAMLPSFSLTASLIVALAVVGFRLVEASRETIPARGIYVRLSARDYNEAKKNMAVSPLVVTVVRTKSDSPQFLLNGNDVKFENLHNALKYELSRRADWVEFVDGDEDLPFQDVVAVVDAANSLHAKCVLLTPHMKQEVTSPPQISTE
jgi:biopolymer transport protein ExbD